MKLLFWGTESVFAYTVLAGLTGDYRPAAVMVPAPTTQVASVEPVSLDGVAPMPSAAISTTQMALQQQLPLYRIRAGHKAPLVTLLQTLDPDLIVVACFPWRISPALLAIPTMGFLNVHPSLLPHYRGPAPLFWQLRAGLRQSGVTVHWMDTTFDTGAIAAQQSLLLAEGATGPMLDAAYATLGVGLLKQVLAQLSVGLMPRQPQPSTGSYHSWPTATDFTLDRAWSARHAFNFMRGTAEWGHSYSLYQAGGAGEDYCLAQALSYDFNRQLSQPIERHGTELAIQFASGILYASLSPTSGQRSPLDLIV